MQIAHALALPLAMLLLVDSLISSGMTSRLSLFFSFGRETFLRQTGHFDMALPGSPCCSPAMRASMMQVWQKRWPMRGTWMLAHLPGLWAQKVLTTMRDCNVGHRLHANNALQG